MPEGPERPESGGWLPPVAPGSRPPGPPGWRVSPKATDAAASAQPWPAPGADPGNSIANLGMWLSIAAFGLFWFFATLALPVALGGTICAAIGRDKIRRGETRAGRMQVDVGLAVGIGTIVLSVALIGVVIALD